MYEAQAKIEAKGGRVVGMQTDCLVLTRDPADVVATDDFELGAFRLAYADDDGVVVGANCWSVGGKTVVPDHPRPTRADVVSLFNTYYVECEATKSGTPRPGMPLSVRVIRRITPPSRAPSLAAD